MRDTGWFTSTFSTSGGGKCVEVNPVSVLTVDVLALVAVVKAGLLDR